MKRLHRHILTSWADAIRRAITLGDADAAYRLTRGMVRRLRDLGLLYDTH